MYVNVYFHVTLLNVNFTDFFVIFGWVGLLYREVRCQVFSMGATCDVATVRVVGGGSSIGASAAPPAVDF